MKKLGIYMKNEIPRSKQKFTLEGITLEFSIHNHYVIFNDIVEILKMCEIGYSLNRNGSSNAHGYGYLVGERGFNFNKAYIDLGNMYETHMRICISPNNYNLSVEVTYKGRSLFCHNMIDILSCISIFMSDEKVEEVKNELSNNVNDEW